MVEQLDPPQCRGHRGVVGVLFGGVLADPAGADAAALRVEQWGGRER